MKYVVMGALLAISSAVGAVEPVQLQGMVKSGTTAKGKCGVANVSVSGLGADGISFDGRIELVSSQGRIALTGDAEPFFLQDNNKAACVESPKGAKLVVVAYCSGTSCNPSEYLVIDPATAKIISKANEDGCSLKCAETAIGGPLPVHLRDGLSNYH